MHEVWKTGERGGEEAGVNNSPTTITLPQPLLHLVSLLNFFKPVFSVYKL